MIHANLGIRTDFSLGESVISADDLADIAKETKSSVIGVCDTMSVSSMIEATGRLAKVDARLMIGVRIRVVMAAEKDQTAAYLKLYPTNADGVRSIYRLLTRSFEPGRFYYVPRVTWDDIADLIDDDCLALSTGDLEAVVQRLDMRDALTDLCKRKRFSALFYELVPATTPYFTKQNKCAIEWEDANQLGAQPLVVLPALYRKGQAEAFSLNASIAERRPYEGYLKPQVDFVPTTAKELAEASVAASEALKSRYGITGAGGVFMRGLTNTVELAKVASYQWSKLEPSLPVIDPEPEKKLTELCRQGWLKRFGSEMFGHKPTAAELANDYMPRLKYELDVLKRLGFAQYFLLVHDLVQWSKQKGILVGPGRGSVGGSLVAYLIGITDVDPIRFKLLFERFINPDRLDLPDIDLDFMSTRREEVVRYLTKRWGAANVAGIVNYNTLGAKSAIKDVGKIYQVADHKLHVTAEIQSVHGVPESLEECHARSLLMQDFSAEFPGLWANALVLQGRMRSYGTHAAGVVVAGEELTRRAVVERRQDSRVINWDKRAAEDQGLIKMDILGLSNLDAIDQIIQQVLYRHGKRIDINQLPLDDAKTLDLFSQATTAGIFQFEGHSVRRLLKEMAKSQSVTFEDLVALNALNRPGPLDAGLTEAYIRRRAGEEPVTYPHPVLEPVLRDTYGVIVYQEQVMQTARDLCGYTPGEADKLRKIMGKKQPEEMKKQRQKFVDGAVSVSQMDPDKADRLFSDIEGFAGYAFNRSHAVEYTLISYQMAYLKAHYLVEFYAATLSIASGDKSSAIARTARQEGLKILPPDVNIATENFLPLNDTIIMAPFSAVDKLSEKTAKAIIEARRDPNHVVIETTSGRGKNKVTTQKTYGPGRFTSIEDFTARVNGVNSRQIEHLDRVGAFARIEPGQPSATDPRRARDQIALMPRIADQTLRAERKLDMQALEVVFNEHFDAMAKEFGPHVMDAHFGDEPSIMVIADAPFNDYEPLEQQYSFVQYVRPSLRAACLDIKHIMWTTLARTPKRKGATKMSAAEVKRCLPYLMREIETTRPAIIILLGGEATRVLLPELKKPNENIGDVIYKPDMDCSFIVGFAPGQIYFTPSKETQLTEIFAKAREMIEDIC